MARETRRFEKERRESRTERYANKVFEAKAKRRETEALLAKTNPEEYARLQAQREKNKSVRSASTKAVLTAAVAAFPSAADALKKNPQLAAAINALPEDQKQTALASLERVTSGVNVQQQRATSSGLGGVFQ